MRSHADTPPARARPRASLAGHVGIWRSQVNEGDRPARGSRRQLREPHGQPDHACTIYRRRHPGRITTAGGDTVRAGGGDAVAVGGAVGEGCLQEQDYLSYRIQATITNSPATRRIKQIA